MGVSPWAEQCTCSVFIIVAYKGYGDTNFVLES